MCTVVPIPVFGSTFFIFIGKLGDILQTSKPASAEELSLQVSLIAVLLVAVAVRLEGAPSETTWATSLQAETPLALKARTR